MNLKMKKKKKKERKKKEGGIQKIKQRYALHLLRYC